MNQFIDGPTAVTIGSLCALLVSWVINLVADLRTARRCLDNLLGVKRQKGGAASLSFRTTFGEHLRPKLEAMQYKLHSLAWEAEHHEGETAAALISQLSTPDFLTYQGSSNELKEFFSHVLPKIRSHFRCTAAAFRIDAPAAGRLHVLSEGVGGERFERQLGKFIAEVWSGSAREGFLDSADAESLVKDFSAFGFRYSWFQVFEIAGQGRAALWLGYRAGQPPLEAELKRLRAVGPQIEQALRSFLKFQELGGKMARAQNLTREKNEVIAHLSHDIRSPLNNLSAILRLLKLEQPEGENTDLIDAALGNCSNASEMINDLLDYSRHRMGRLETRIETFCVGDLVDQIAETFAGAVKDKGLSFCVDRRGGISHWVSADRRQVRRVVSNLIENAVKYTAKGRISVEVESAEGTTSVIIRDTGVGMSQEQLARLFTPFTRFHTGAAEGIGLGLALSKALVELNHGSIRARSEVGRGTEFTLHFKSVAASSSLSNAAPVRRALNGARILLVDDDVNCTDSLARALRTFGCEVSKTNSTGEAEELMASGDWHAVISDGRMCCGGALKLLQGRAKSGKKAPFAVLSGDPEDTSRLRALGAAAVFMKPVDIEALIEFLTTAAAVPNAAGAKGVFRISSAAG